MSLEKQKTNIETHEVPSEREIDHQAALRELYTLSPEVAEQYRPILWAAGEKTAATLVNPQQRYAVSLLTQSMDWALFGKSGDRLPSGLVLTTDERVIVPKFDTRIPYLNASTGYLGDKILENGAEQILPVTTELATANKEKAQEIIVDYLQQSPEYKLIEAFDEPEPQDTEQPLTLYWRNVHEARIDTDAKSQYGLAPAHRRHNGPWGSFVSKIVQKRKNQLDDLTVPLNESQKDHPDAIIRLQNFIADMYKKALDEEGRTFKEFIIDERGFFAALSVDGKETDIYKHMGSVSEKILELAGSQPQSFMPISHVFLTAVIHDVFSAQFYGSSKKLAAILTDASVGSAQTFVNHRLPAALTGSMAGYTNEALGDLGIIRQPSGEYVSFKKIDDLDSDQQTNGLHWQEILNDKVEFVSREAADRLKRRPLGEVTIYEPRDSVVPLRMLLTQGRDQALPERSGFEEELVMNMFEDNLYIFQRPFVPGYILVSEDLEEGRWGFVANPEGDPYLPCWVPIDQRRRALLAKEYRALGLGDLADDIEGASAMTVTQLALLVKEATDYYYPEGGSIHSQKFSKLKHFRMYTRDGKLEAQCTGSAQFFKLSLEHIFGEGVAGVLNGRAISGSNGRISSAGHAQVIWTHEGKQYIFDTTGTEASNQRPQTQFGKRASPPSRPSGLTLPPFDHPAPADTPAKGEFKSTLTKRTPAEEIADSLQGLNEYLKIVYNVPAIESVYEKLIILPPDDPARQVTEVLLQLLNGRLANEAASKKLETILAITQSDDATRAKIGIKKYSSGFLSEIEHTASRAHRALRKTTQ